MDIVLDSGERINLSIDETPEISTLIRLMSGDEFGDFNICLSSNDAADPNRMKKTWFTGHNCTPGGGRQVEGAQCGFMRYGSYCHGIIGNIERTTMELDWYLGGKTGQIYQAFSCHLTDTDTTVEGVTTTRTEIQEQHVLDGCSWIDRSTGACFLGVSLQGIELIGMANIFRPTVVADGGEGSLLRIRGECGQSTDEAHPRTAGAVEIAGGDGWGATDHGSDVILSAGRGPILNGQPSINNGEVRLRKASGDVLVRVNDSGLWLAETGEEVVICGPVQFASYTQAQLPEDLDPGTVVFISDLDRLGLKTSTGWMMIHVDELP